MNYNRDRCCTMLLTVDALHPAAIRKNTLQRWGGCSWVGSRQRHRAGQQLITVAETIFMAFTRSVDRWQRWRCGLQSSRTTWGSADTSHTHTHTQAHKLFCYAAGQSSSSPFVFLCVSVKLRWPRFPFPSIPLPLLHSPFFVSLAIGFTGDR